MAGKRIASPAEAILFVLVLGVNLLGDGLRDLFGARADP